MLCYYFTITFFVEGVKALQTTSYMVEDASRVRAWRKATDYAIGMYGLCLHKVELHTISTY